MAKGKKTGGRNFSGTPGPGRPPFPPDLKEGRKLTKTLFESLVHKYTGLPRENLINIIKDPKTPVLDVIVCQVLKEAMVRGDQNRLGFILDRIIGKVPDPPQEHKVLVLKQQVVGQLEELELLKAMETEMQRLKLMEGVIDVQSEVSGK